MSYPETILTRPVRRGITIFLTLVFFTISPLLILYTAGFRYDWETKRILETGVISVDEIEPREVDVKLGTLELSKRTPIRLANRAPGTYHIEISKPGYKPWIKDITVKSRETTFVKFIDLIKESLPITAVENDWDIKNISGSDDGRHVLVENSQEEEKQFILFDTIEKTTSTVFVTNNSDGIKNWWSPNNRLVAFFEPKDTLSRLTLIDVNNLEQKQSYTLNSRVIEQIQWIDDGDVLLAQDGFSLLAFSIERFRRIQQISQNLLWFIDKDNDLWILNKENLTLVNSTQGKPSISLPNAQSYEQIVGVEKDLILIQAEQGLVIIKENDNEYTTEFIHTQKTNNLEDRKEWLAWSPWELWRINNQKELELLNRTGDSISDVKLLNEHGVLAIAMGENLETYDPDYVVSHNLFNDKIEQMVINSDQKRIYFLGTVAGKRNLFELEF